MHSCLRVVAARLFPPLSAFSLTFLTCGCDAERISGAPSGDAQCACASRGGISCRQEGSDEEERKHRQQTYIAGDHSFTAGVLSLLPTCREKKKTVLCYRSFRFFSPQGWRSPICVGSNISGESEEYQTPLVDVDSWTVDMEKIVNLSVSVLLVLWGCALGGSPSVQIGRYPLVQTLKKKTRIG